jgi:hypothetical protein
VWPLALLGAAVVAGVTVMVVAWTHHPRHRTWHIEIESKDERE